MIQKLKNLITVFALSSMFLVPALVPVTAHAQATCDKNTVDIQGCLETGACFNTDAANCAAAGDNAKTRVNTILTTVINIFSVVVGFVAVVMIIIGGLKYITSSGDSGNVTGAKNTILYAIIGLVVVALAQIIVHFVLQKVAPS